MQGTDDIDPICGQGGSRAREVLDLVSDKWSLYIVAALRTGPLRFNQARRIVTGISQRMLTVTLRRLERDGLVSRTVTPTVPPQVTYALTETGDSLCRAVQPLIDWAFTRRRHRRCPRDLRRPSQRTGVTVTPWVAGN